MGVRIKLHFDEPKSYLYLGGILIKISKSSRCIWRTGINWTFHNIKSYLSRGYQVKTFRPKLTLHLTGGVKWNFDKHKMVKKINFDDTSWESSNWHGNLVAWCACFPPKLYHNFTNKLNEREEVSCFCTCWFQVKLRRAGIIVVLLWFDLVPKKY